MSHIQPSITAPYINIEARTESHYRAAESAIRKIASKNNGASLLNEIQKLSAKEALINSISEDAAP